MTKLFWDRVGDRRYESGLDQGVLYLPDGSGIPWNGLTSIVEKFNKNTNSVYYDGMKISELVTLGEFSASMKAITYPDEFEKLEGQDNLCRGVLLGDQMPKSFGLCYRTMVGNDVDGQDASYKIHIIYNVLAFPSDKTNASRSMDLSLAEFEWNITATPEEVPGHHPTSHIVIESADVDPWLLAEIEKKIYGSPFSEAVLIPMADLIAFIRDWARVKIIDNGDGTWTAIASKVGFLFFPKADHTYFELKNIKAEYLDADTFQISDTVDNQYTAAFVVHDNGDGTWTAHTYEEGVIVMLDQTSFEIRNIELDFSGPDMYRFASSSK